MTFPEIKTTFIYLLKHALPKRKLIISNVTQISRFQSLRERMELNSFPEIFKLGFQHLQTLDIFFTCEDILTRCPCSEETRKQGCGRGREVRVGAQAGQTFRAPQGYRGARTATVGIRKVTCIDLNLEGLWRSRRSTVQWKTRLPAATCSLRATPPQPSSSIR